MNLKSTLKRTKPVMALVTGSLLLIQAFAALRRAGVVIQHRLVVLQAVRPEARGHLAGGALHEAFSFDGRRFT